MALFDKQANISSNTGAATRASERDEGLRGFMLHVYNYMTCALILTGLVAYFAAGSEAFLSMMYTAKDNGTVGMSPLAWVVMLAPIGFLFLFGAKLHTMSYSAAQFAFWAFSVVMGLSLFYIFVAYTGVSIARVFFITAATFGTMSLYGYTTKRDLSGWGSFLTMGLIGIIIASVVNLFLASSALHFAISIIGVLVFTGLIAFDTQKLKAMYYQYGHDEQTLKRMGIVAALSLYLDFINLFVMLLRLFGDRR